MPREAKTQQATTIDGHTATPENMEENGLLVANPQDIIIAYENWEREKKEKETRTNAQRVRGFSPCSCVSFARWKTGINVGPIGVARKHPINSQTPNIGAIVITGESASGHLAVVAEMDSEFITIIEANYLPCAVTLGRKISRNSPIILGYYLNN